MFGSLPQKKEMISNFPQKYPEIPRNTRKYPRVKKIPENTRSYILTLLPDPNPTRYPVFFPIPDPTRPDIEKLYTDCSILTVSRVCRQICIGDIVAILSYTKVKASSKYSSRPAGVFVHFCCCCCCCCICPLSQTSAAPL